MKFRQARKILRRKRQVRYVTAMRAIRRLRIRSERWARRIRDVVPNPRPTFTSRDLLINLPALVENIP